MKAKKVGIIFQARMGSKRLPGKVLKLLDNFFQNNSANYKIGIIIRFQIYLNYI